MLFELKELVGSRTNCTGSPTDAFSGDDDFFNVYTEKNLNFGSFARHTKIRPLDDIDVSVYEKMSPKENYWTDLEFRDLLNALSNAIYNEVPDPKGLQGDLNSFTSIERMQISLALKQTYNKAVEASKLELTDKDQAAAIAKWREVFGSAFPSFSN